MVPTTPVASHRRISSLKATTLNFFKGPKGSQFNNQTGSTRQPEFKIGAPSSVPEEGELAPLRAVTEPIVPERRSQRSYSISGSINASLFREKAAEPNRESLGNEDNPEGFLDMLSRESSPVRSRRLSDVGMATGEGVGGAPSVRTTKTSTKLKMALNLLRRRSNPNLRKAYADPIGEEDEIAARWGPFQEPLLDPDDIQPRSASAGPIRKGAPPSVPVPKGAFGQKSDGSRFGLRSRNSGRTYLTKAPSDDTRRRRRATVASVVLDTTEQPPIPHLWSAGAPRGSLSSTIGDGNLHGDELLANDVMLGREGVGEGGLFPRPSSLQRNWSDGPSKHAERKARVGEENTSRRHSRRPLSFSGVSNGYGNMKITEAASLDTRVRDLEDQVAALQNVIARSVDGASESINFPITENTRHSLQPPFEEGKLSVRHATDRRSSWSSRNGSPPATPKLSTFSRSEKPGVEGPSPRTLRRRAETLHMLEGLDFSTENKRNTASTIRATRRKTSSGSPHTESQSSPVPTVSLAQYTGLMAMVKREQRARRKLEGQVAMLQEQMTTVLHRHLLAQSSHSPSITTDAASTILKPAMPNTIHRKASSEVPTPELTPPRLNNHQSTHFFTGYDSDAGTDDSTEDEGDRRSISLYIGTNPDNSEVWETPAEEKSDILGRQMGGTISIPSSPESTRSLSKLTHRSGR